MYGEIYVLGLISRMYCNDSKIFYISSVEKILDIYMETKTLIYNLN